MPDATPRPLTAPDVVAIMLAGTDADLDRWQEAQEAFRVIVERAIEQRHAGLLADVAERDERLADAGRQVSAALKTVSRWQGENQRLIAERDAHKLRADHYEGLWRKEHGLPPDGTGLEAHQ